MKYQILEHKADLKIRGIEKIKNHCALSFFVELVEKTPLVYKDIVIEAWLNGKNGPMIILSCH